MGKVLKLVLTTLMLFMVVGCAPSDSKKGGIVSTAPSNTEILVALGLSERIVAADTYSQDVAGLPETCKFLDFQTPNVEELLALKPDMIIVADINVTDTTKPTYDMLAEKGIKVVYIKTQAKVVDIYTDILKIAEETGAVNEGKELVDDMKAQIDEIVERTKKVSEKKTVYFEISPAPSIYTFGGDNFSNDLLETAGGINIFKEQKGWFSPSEEEIIKQDPDAILTNVSYIEDSVGQIKARESFKTMTAIKNGNVFFIDANATSRPSHNVVKAILQINQALYPELYE